MSPEPRRIHSPDALARELASRARALRQLASQAPDPDALAQALVCSLLVARCVGHGPDLSALSAIEPAGHQEQARRLVEDTIALLAPLDVDQLFRRDSAALEAGPVIHFYELFLENYDPQTRTRRGVFYTPRPVVSYIVRSVDALLRSELGLADGLADAAVRILDPATGTGTFLVEVIGLIHRTMLARWKAQGHDEPQIAALWSAYVPRDLLPRLHGRELMATPCAIARLAIALTLADTGYCLRDDDTIHVHQGNALDQRRVEAPRVAVLLGNPPYALHSANLEPAHRALVEAYKFVGGERVRERSALQLEKNLNDDYVKFVRLAQLEIERSGMGVMGLVTNHSFLDNPTLRGMRWSLLRSFTRLWFNDLHGSTTKRQRSAGDGDENVFQIKQGVAITLGVRGPEAERRGEAGSPPGVVAEVRHHDLWGTRRQKEAWLAANDAGTHGWKRLTPGPDLHLCSPQDGALGAEYEAWPRLPDVMSTSGAGYITARDGLVIDHDREALIARIEAFKASDEDDGALLAAFGVAGKKGWDVRRSREELKRIDVAARVIPTSYRPFDLRWIFFDATLVWGRSWPTLRHVVEHPRNLTMLATRITHDPWDVWVARAISSHKAMSAYDTNSVFPLYLVAPSSGPPRANFSTAFLGKIARATGLSPRDGETLPPGLSPEDIFHYLYAVLQSPAYRRRYEAFLEKDFPRLPLPGSAALLRALARLGGELVAVHLLEAPGLERAAYSGPPRPEVGRVGWSDDTVWLDAARQQGSFRGVAREVWEHFVGGHQVCRKWLNDRRGRALSAADIVHYRRVVGAIAETLRRRQEIDREIDAHGGWPGAFVAPETAPG